MATVRSKAVLFGLNYAYDPQCALQGCVNDVQAMAEFLTKECKIPCEIFTDDVNRAKCTAMSMVQRLYQLGCESYSQNLDLVWIHYSGHGSYIKDTNKDELDGQDECLVPSDYATAGLIPDDILCQLFQCFNPKTRVICVFDCCHSGTIGDVKYSWEGPRSVQVENIVCPVTARVITLSGCLDTQTSADAFNVIGNNKYMGALTGCLLTALKQNKEARTNVFTLCDAVRRLLAAKGFSQKAKLCSSHNLAFDSTFLL